MALTAQQKLQIKKLLKEVKGHRAPHTEFVTVYIPAGYDIIKIIQQQQETLFLLSSLRKVVTGVVLKVPIQTLKILMLRNQIGEVCGKKYPITSFI